MVMPLFLPESKALLLSKLTLAQFRMSRFHQGQIGDLDHIFLCVTSNLSCSFSS